MLNLKGARSFSDLEYIMKSSEIMLEKEFMSTLSSEFGRRNEGHRKNDTSIGPERVGAIWLAICFLLEKSLHTSLFSNRFLLGGKAVQPRHVPQC